MPIPLSIFESRRELSELTELPGATHLSPPAGQVLIYRDHHPPGIFLVLRGQVEVPEERGRRRPVPFRLDASPARPVLIPRLDLLQEPSQETWTVSEAAEVLYLPRSLVQGDADLQSRLRNLATG